MMTKAERAGRPPNARYPWERWCRTLAAGRTLYLLRGSGYPASTGVTSVVKYLHTQVGHRGLKVRHRLTVQVGVNGVITAKLTPRSRNGVK